MCGRVLDAGYSVTVSTRSRDKAEALEARGAQWADSPKSVAESSDVVFSIVGFPDDVRAVHLGENGTLRGCAPGSVIVDMTTSQPELAEEIAQTADQHDVASLDAPVSGGDVGAKNGTLSIMVGGDRHTFDRLRPLWDAIGKTVVYQGLAGAGQHTKMVNQTLVAANMVGVCEALLYAHKAGLDLDTVLQTVTQGAAGSWALSNLGPRIVEGDFAPGFYVEHFVKDMQIALSEAERMRLSLPGLELARQLYNRVVAQGHARSGTHALQLALAALSNVDWPTQ